jgi:signal transduction histidine kinase
MSFAQIKRLLSTASFRLSAVYAALLVLSFLVASGGAWLVTRSAALHEAGIMLSVARSDFERDTNGRSDDVAIAAVNERMGRHDALLWRLTAPDGRTLAGEAALPSDVVGIGVVDLRGADFAVLTDVLSSGNRLSIADDIERTERIRNAVLQSLLWVGIGASFLAVSAGIWLTRRSLARMDALGEAVRAFGAGDLNARAPTRATSDPDDVDDLIERVNNMLVQVNVLIANVRRVSVDVAHDLRTPLTHLRQRLEAARAASDPDARHATIDHAQSSIDEILRTFDAMLRLSAIGSDARRERFTAVDLAEVTESVCDAYRPDIELSGRTLTFAADDNGVINGDRHSLTLAVSNLLENAIRHTPTGTVIEVRVRATARRVDLVISDTGPGIPENLRAAVVEPFKRLDESRTEQGSGLGLSITAAVARQHDATLKLEDNAPGLRVTLAFAHYPDQIATDAENAK